MAALFGGLSRRSYGDYKSSAPDPPDGTAGLIPDAIAMGTTGVILIDQRCAPMATGVNGNGHFNGTGTAIVPVSIVATVN